MIRSSSSSTFVDWKRYFFSSSSSLLLVCFSFRQLGVRKGKKMSAPEGGSSLYIPLEAREDGPHAHTHTHADICIALWTIDLENLAIRYARSLILGIPLFLFSCCIFTSSSSISQIPPPSKWREGECNDQNPEDFRVAHTCDLHVVPFGDWLASVIIHLDALASLSEFDCRRRERYFPYQLTLTKRPCCRSDKETLAMLIITPQSLLRCCWTPPKRQRSAEYLKNPKLLSRCVNTYIFRHLLSFLEQLGVVVAVFEFRSRRLGWAIVCCDWDSCEQKMLSDFFPGETNVWLWGASGLSPLSSSQGFFCIGYYFTLRHIPPPAVKRC